MPHLPGIYVDGGNLNSGPHNKRQEFCPQSHPSSLSFFKVLSALLCVSRTSLAHCLSALTSVTTNAWLPWMWCASIRVCSCFQFPWVCAQKQAVGWWMAWFLFTWGAVTLQYAAASLFALPPASVSSSGTPNSVAGSGCASWCVAVSHGHFPSDE